MTAPAGHLARWGQALVIAGLVAIVLALLPLHGGRWWPGGALAWQWQAAAGSLLGYGVLCAAIAWRARPPRRRRSATPPLQVVWASQTGFACELAERSVAALQAAGVDAEAIPLHALDADLLRRSLRLLFVASTTGEGDPPDHALAFQRGTQPQVSDLSQLHYGLLALGDRSYDDFCAFGRQLDDWLAHRGAHALFDRVEVDNADPGALRHWQYLLGQLGDGSTQADWERPRYQAWQLCRRETRNPGCREGEVHRLALVPASGDWPAWQAGDIAEIGPRHAAEDVERWLRARGLDGERRIEQVSLHDLLARAQWPGDEVATGSDAWIEALQPLPHREYSIASLPSEQRLELLVRQHTAPDGRLGLGSGWLTRHAPIGARIDLRIRANPGFHPPPPAMPLILVGNGTGIAGLRAHLAARVQAGARRNWLLFGERHAAHDNHFGEDLDRWRDEGWIERLDAVYSRDGGRYHYVQDALADATDELRAWVAAGAAIYVCGSLHGMAPAVDAVLEQALGSDVREALLAEGRYRRDIY